MNKISFLNFESGISFVSNSKTYFTSDGYILEVFFELNKKSNTEIRKALIELNDGEKCVFIISDRVWNKVSKYDLRDVNIGFVFSIISFSSDKGFITNLSIDKIILDDSVSIIYNKNTNLNSCFDDSPKSHYSFLNTNNSYFDKVKYYVETILKGDKKRFVDSFENLNKDCLDSITNVINILNYILDENKKDKIHRE